MTGQSQLQYKVDASQRSLFPFIFQTKTTSFANVKNHLQELFMIEGIPNEVMSDNGPPFSNKEFNSLLQV